MNQLAQCVPQGGGFPILGVLFVLVLVGCAYLWRSGKLGPANEAIIKAQLAKAKTAVASWEAKLQAKTAGAPKDKPTRLAELDAMLAAGSIKQEERDAARAKIINE